MLLHADVEQGLTTLQMMKYYSYAGAAAQLQSFEQQPR
jgi:hypothetical protein